MGCKFGASFFFLEVFWQNPSSSSRLEVGRLMQSHFSGVSRESPGSLPKYWPGDARTVAQVFSTHLSWQDALVRF